MPRKKKIENETEEQAQERILFETITNNSNRSAKTTWKRKLDKMQSIIELLKPIEQKIFNILETEKQPLLDKIHTLRTIMVDECVHPYDFLVQKNGFVECKFCNKRIYVKNASPKEKI